MCSLYGSRADRLVAVAHELCFYLVVDGTAALRPPFEAVVLVKVSLWGLDAAVAVGSSPVGKLCTVRETGTDYLLHFLMFLGLA